MKSMKKPIVVSVERKDRVPIKVEIEIMGEHIFFGRRKSIKEVVELCRCNYNNYVYNNNWIDNYGKAIKIAYAIFYPKKKKDNKQLKLFKGGDIYEKDK